MVVDSKFPIIEKSELDILKIIVIKNNAIKFNRLDFFCVGALIGARITDIEQAIH